jgi:hypothetical protein
LDPFSHVISKRSLVDRRPLATEKNFNRLVARQKDDTEGVEEISPRLPDSERATPGPKAFRAKRGERSEYLPSSVQSSPVDTNFPNRHEFRQSLFVNFSNFAFAPA